MKLKYIPLGALAVIGAGEVIRRVVQGTAWALSAWGGWDATEATQAAPWLCAAVAAGLAISLYNLHQDNQRYKRQSYGHIDRTHARTEEPEYRKNRRGA